jgi:serine O-acetyltransferase
VLANLSADTRRLREIKTKSFPWYVLESLLFENGYQAVVLHRIAHWFKRRRIPMFGPFFARLSLFLTGVDIGPGAVIGPGLWISHGVGLVIGGNARLGHDATLLHGVTIGAPGRGRQSEMPTIGDSVFIGAGAAILGAVRIGDRVFIGVNVVVTRDVPDDSLVLLRGEPEIRPMRDAAAARELASGQS